MIKVEVSMSDFIDGRKFIDKYGDRIEKVMAATMQTNRLLLFMHDGAYNGHKPWKPLKFRDGQPLQDSGALRNSIGPKVPAGSLAPVTPGKGGYVRYEASGSKKTVRIGTELKYAKIHDEGGVIVPVNAKALRFVVGKKVYFFKKVKIPKRNFTQWNAEDQAEMTTTLHRLLEKIVVEALNGG